MKGPEGWVPIGVYTSHIFFNNLGVKFSTHFFKYKYFKSSFHTFIPSNTSSIVDRNKNNLGKIGDST